MTRPGITLALLIVAGFAGLVALSLGIVYVLVVFLGEWFEQWFDGEPRE